MKEFMARQGSVWQKVIYSAILIISSCATILGLYQIFYNNHRYSVFIFALGLIGIMSFMKKTIFKLLVVILGLIIILLSKPPIIH